MKKILIAGDLFSGLRPWLIDDKDPRGMPGVYNLYQWLGKSEDYHFKSIIVNEYVEKDINFPNGSVIHMRKLPFKNHTIFRIVSVFFLFIELYKLDRKYQSDFLYGMANYVAVVHILGVLKRKYAVGRVFGTLVPGLWKRGHKLYAVRRHFMDFFNAKFSSGLLISTNDGTEYDYLVRMVSRKHKFLHLYNGIEKNFRSELLSIPCASPISTKKKIKIASIGRLAYWKRHDLSIMILDQLVHKYGIDAELNISGGGALLGSLVEQAKRLNLEDRVSFKGVLARKEYLSLLEETDICIYAYDNSNVGNAFWESMLAARCIVAKNSGDTGSIIDGNNGLIIDDKHFVEEASLQINELLNSNRSTDLALNARKFTEQFLLTWEKRLEIEFKEIENCLSKKDA
jgi:glycosyltransferase involved in cell wall biosynthesis